MSETGNNNNNINTNIQIIIILYFRSVVRRLCKIYNNIIINRL